MSHEKMVEQVQEYWRATAPSNPQCVLVSGEPGSGKTHLLHTLAQSTFQHLLDGRALLPQLVRLLQADIARDRRAALLTLAAFTCPELRWPLVNDVQPSTPEVLEQGEQQLAEVLVKHAQTLGGWGAAIDQCTLDEGSVNRRVLLSIWRAAALSQAPLMLVIVPQESRTAGEQEPPTAPHRAFSGELRRIAVLSSCGKVHEQSMPLLTVQELTMMIQARVGLAAPDVVEWLYRHTYGHPQTALVTLSQLTTQGIVRRAEAAWILDERRAEEWASRPQRQRVLMNVQDRPFSGAQQDVLKVLTLAGGSIPQAVLSRALNREIAVLNVTLAELEKTAVLRVSTEAAREVQLTAPELLPYFRQQWSDEALQALYPSLLDATDDLNLKAHFVCVVGDRSGSHWVQQALRKAVVARDYHRLKAFYPSSLNLLAAEQTKEFFLPYCHALTMTGEALHAVQLFEQQGDFDDVEKAVPCYLNSLRLLGEHGRIVKLIEGNARYAAIPALRFDLAKSLVILRKYEEAGKQLKSLVDDHSFDRENLDWRIEHVKTLRFTPETALAESLQLLESEGLSEQQLVAVYQCVALNSLWCRKFDEASHYFEKTIQLLTQLGEEATVQGVYSNLAGAFFANSKFREAERYAAKSIQLCEAVKDEGVLFQALTALANAQIFQGNAEGLTHLAKVYEHARKEESGFEIEQALFLTSLMLGYGRMEEAQAIYKDIDQTRIAGQQDNVKSTLVEIHLMLGDIETARAIYNSLDHSGEGPYPKQIKLYNDVILGLAEKKYQHVIQTIQAADEFLDWDAHDGHVIEMRWALMIAHLATGQYEQATSHVRPINEFLHWSGGYGIFKNLDRVHPEGQQERHALLSRTPEQTSNQAAPPAPHQKKDAPFIRTLGQYELEVNGENQPWKARKPRELLALLLTASVSTHDTTLEKDALIDQLWPDLPEQQGQQNFQKTLQRLKTALGTSATIEGSRRGYTLLSAHSDLHFYLQALSSGDLSAAVSWYAGDYLPGIHFPITDELRDTLRNQWQAAATQLIQEQSSPYHLSLLKRLLNDDPYNDDFIALLPNFADQSPEEVNRLVKQVTDTQRRELGELSDALQAVRQSLQHVSR